MKRDICLLVEGALLERLLETALAQGAHFARIRRLGARKMRVETDEGSADVLLALCRKYGLNCRVLHRGGCAAMRDFARRRWTLLPALALSVLLCILFLNHIWLVDVRFTEDGTQPELSAQIYACLEENGISPGISRRQIEPSLLKRQILAAVEELSYVGVRRQGIRLLVEASPEVPAPQVYALADVRDLLAAKAGVVKSVTVYSGEACVQPGDTVLRGDILIRGAEEKSKEETTPVGALGRVIARCWYAGEACAPLNAAQSVPTGRQSFGCHLRLGSFSLTLTEAESYSSEDVQIEALPIVGLFLPLTLERDTHCETTTLHQSVDRAETERRLARLAHADALRQVQNDNLEYEIASSWMNVQTQNDTLRIRAVYEIYTDIAVTRDALIEEVY